MDKKMETRKVNAKSDWMGSSCLQGVLDRCRWDLIPTGPACLLCVAVSEFVKIP